MKNIKKILFLFLLIIWPMFFLSSCVTETQTGPFKQPTKDDLARAISLYIQITYKYLDNKDYERAMLNVKKALDLDANSPAALNALAIVYQYQGDTEKARTTFKHAISEDDKFTETHLNYGQFLYQQQEYAEACKQFQIAADDDFYVKRAEAYYNLGVCYRTMGDKAKSEGAFGRSVGLDPHYIAALIELSSIRYDQQQYPEAKALFDQYVQQVRETEQAFSSRALWLGIRLERVFHNQDAEASWALQLKHNYPYSKEYLEYQNSLAK